MIEGAKLIRLKGGLCMEELNAPWREILHKGKKCLMPKGHRETCIGTQFFLIISGRVRLEFSGRTGWDNCSLHLGPGCLFNEATVLRKVSRSQLRFLCLEDTEAWSFPISLLHNEEFVAEYPKLYVNLAQSMAIKLSELLLYLMYARGGSSLCRISGMLLKLSQSKNPQKMSQSDVAMMLGLHPTTVARHMRTLRERGIIGVFTKNRLEVLNMPELQKLAEL